MPRSEIDQETPTVSLLENMLAVLAIYVESLIAHGVRNLLSAIANKLTLRNKKNP